MNKEVCKSFMSVWDFFPDELEENKYKFNNNNFLDSYCVSNSCDTDLAKINGGSLYLFNKFFGSSEFFESVANSNINIVEYILIWLSYMLNLKQQVGDETNLQYFYKMYVLNHEKYKNSIMGVDGYTSYKELIDKKTYFLDMDKKIISNFYEAFKLLCEMYNEFDDNSQFCAKCSENANQFINKYREMNKNSDITNNSSYNELLSTLSKDYDNFINKYNNNQHFKSSPLPAIEEIQTSGQISGDISSSSSVTNKLFTVLSIFGAIAFLLGTSYKYSLFGFRKRFQKQKLREKIKNIKKRINH
ncbi:PIR protein [Plasmodium yoelii]|nr:PIR protein [Plasmodium yoelii]CDS44694.1 YIR protein [Plasmodium yoelii]VTZ79806.1 PIR protein [Plasmodium yoelii]|eukprot:XP_022812529.1 PIR protein [Plasmodium yoelii]